MKTVIEIAADYFGVAADSLNAAKRDARTRAIRGIAAAVAIGVYGSRKTGQMLGFFDGSGAINAAKNITKRAEVEPHIARDLENVKLAAQGLPPLERIAWPDKAQNSCQYPSVAICECDRRFLATSRTDANRGCPRCRKMQTEHDRRQGRAHSRPWTYVEPFSVSMPSRKFSYA